MRRPPEQALARQPSVPGRSRARASRRWLGWLLLAIAIAITVRVLANNSGELRTAADELRRVQPLWVAVAVLLEIGSYAAYGAAQGRLLRSGAAEVGVLPLTAVAVTGQAAANCLPGGLAVSATVMFRQLRRRHVGEGLVAATLVLTSLLYVAALAILGLVAVQIAGSADPLPELRVISLVVIAVLAAAVAVTIALKNHSPLHWVADRVDVLTAWWHSRRHEAAGTARATDGLSWREALSRVSLTPTVLGSSLGLLLVSWLTDAGVLTVSFAAVGTSPPWRGLLLAYCAGQLAATLPITPGGLGVVEGSLTVALVAFGGQQSLTLTAVLLYRLVSFWGLLPAGLLAYIALRTTGPRHNTGRVAGRAPAEEAVA